MKPDHEHHHHHHHLEVHEASSVSMSKSRPVDQAGRSPESSLLMVGSVKRMLYASCLIALLWLAVAWAVSSVD